MLARVSARFILAASATTTIVAAVLLPMLLLSDWEERTITCQVARETSQALKVSTRTYLSHSWATSRRTYVRYRTGAAGRVAREPLRTRSSDGGPDVVI